MDGHGPLGHEMSTLAMQWLPLLVLRVSWVTGGLRIRHVGFLEMHIEKKTHPNG